MGRSRKIKGQLKEKSVYKELQYWKDGKMTDSIAFVLSSQKKLFCD